MVRLPSPFDRQRGGLVVAHPGHELRVHAWLELARPPVWILTDGSGSGEHGRLASTRKVLASAGATPAGIFGRVRDRDAYRWLVEGQAKEPVALIGELAEGFLAAGVDYVVGDALEGFNPVHDLCRLLIDAALARVARLTGRSLANLDFPLEAHPDAPVERPTGGLRLELDDAALARKLDAARAYPELRSEVEAALARLGPRAFAVERLAPVVTSTPLADRLPTPPAYERYGHERVAAGRYRTVLRLAEHFLPLAEKIRRREGLP